MSLNIVGEDNFKKDVLEAEVPVLVDFTAVWCGPCLVIAPVLLELEKEYDGRMRLVKVDVDENNILAAKYGIAAIPTMLIFKGGKAVKQFVGLKSKKDLKAALDELMED
jgi:thioredoxin 1